MAMSCCVAEYNAELNLIGTYLPRENYLANYTDRFPGTASLIVSLFQNYSGCCNK